MNTKTTVISSTISNIQNWPNFCKLFTYVAAEADQKKNGSLTPTHPTNQPHLNFFGKLFFKFLMMPCHFCRCVFNASFCHLYFNLKLQSRHWQVGSLLGQHLYKLGSWQSGVQIPARERLYVRPKLKMNLKAVWLEF